MHTCTPPIEALEERLEEHPSVNGNFGHLLLLQKEADDGTLCQALRPYFESAHLDARQTFHAEILSQVERNSATAHGGLPEGGFNALVPELDVTDLDASLKFWCGMLGFKVAYDRPAAKFAYLERAGAQIMLCQINGEWLTGKLEAPFGRGINFQIEVDNLDLILSTLLAAIKMLWGGGEGVALLALLDKPLERAPCRSRMI
jgi:Glyoxalase/Bleomycin resistance protein/Dioxygenase superfamily